MDNDEHNVTFIPRFSSYGRAKLAKFSPGSLNGCAEDVATTRWICIS